MRTPLLLASSLVLLLGSPLLAQDSQPSKPAATLGQSLAAASKAGALKEGKRHTYFKGKNPSVALVEHELTLAKGALTSVFTEHGSGGAFVRSTYRIDAEGVLQGVTIERGTRDSYPEATETQRYAREKDELVEQVKEGTQPERSPLPKGAIPMAVVTFFLPNLAEHLPTELEFTPVFEAQVHTQTMALETSATKGGFQLAIKVGGQAAVTLDVSSKGRVEQMTAPGGNVIKPLSKEDAEAALAKLRPA